MKDLEERARQKADEFCTAYLDRVLRGEYASGSDMLRMRTADVLVAFAREAVEAELGAFEPREYVAANLLEALQHVPDTGDWHGQLRHWCRANKGNMTPNQPCKGCEKCRRTTEGGSR